MVKVRFTCDWTDDSSLLKRFKNCYSYQNGEINFDTTLGKDYDILVSINKPVYTPKSANKKYIGVLMEPSWFLGALKKEQIYHTCDYVISFTKESKYNNNIYYPGILPFHLTYESGPNLSYYLTNVFTPKSKLCSMVVSRDKNFGESNFYTKRIKLAEEILKTTLPIDIYGKGWEDYKEKDPRIKGELNIEEKYKGLIDYKFSICIENCREDSYFTEKVTDCILTDTIPIYYGCEHLNNFFKSPIILDSLEINSVLKIFKKGTLQYNSNICGEDKKLLGNKFNLFVAITKLVNKII